MKNILSKGAVSMVPGFQILVRKNSLLFCMSVDYMFHIQY